LNDRSRQLGEPRSERGTQASALGCRVTECGYAAPRNAVDEPGDQREFSKRPPGPFWTREQALEEGAERPSQRELVRDRFGKDEHLDELRWRPAPAHFPLAATVRESPRFPTLGSQPVRDSIAGQLREF